MKKQKKSEIENQNVYADEIVRPIAPQGMTETKQAGIYLDGVGSLWVVERDPLHGCAELRKLFPENTSG